MQGRTLSPRSLDDPGRLASELFSSLDLASTATACTKIAAEAAQASKARLYLVNGGSVRLVAESVDGFAVAHPARTRLPRALIQRVRDAAARRVPAEDESDGRSTMMPVLAGDRPIGVFAVEHGLGDSLSAEARAALSKVACLSGLALSNALAYREVHERAERLTDLERAKSQFLNLASHELRGPLTVLMGYLSLLEDGAFGEVPAELGGVLPAINARIAEMEALINAMLETARLEDDRLELTLADEDLGAIAAEALERAEAFTQSGQQLTLSRPAERVPANVDRARVVLTIGNLLHNAIKYSVEHTDVRCEVRVEGDDALVAVSDRGIGIAAADVSTLFTRFGRVRTDPAARAIPGTGLGLFLARELARAHGGDITVDSVPGQGSTFTLRLPIAR